MRSIRRILVALKDPAAEAAPALVKAEQLAKALGAELELFHAIATPLYVCTSTVMGPLASSCPGSSVPCGPVLWRRSRRSRPA
jgi:hypothetical protein